jgi:hypothetical protein
VTFQKHYAKEGEVKMSVKKARIERMKVVNEIIKEIGSRGRNFFLDKDMGHTSFFSFSASKKSRLWFYDKAGGQVNPYPSRKAYDHYHFSDGGTLWALVQDFSEFILTGNFTNGKNGYGGLYCPHWGYPEEDMKAIRKLALKLGYLKGN